MSAATQPAPAAIVVEFPCASMNVSKIAHQIQRDFGKGVGAQMIEALRLLVGPGRVTMGACSTMRRSSRFAQGRRAIPGGQLMDRADQRQVRFLCNAVGPRLSDARCERRLRGKGPRRFLCGHHGARFLRDESNYPMFSKPIDGSLGIGTGSWASYDAKADAIVASDDRKTPIEELVDTITEAYARAGYLF